MATGAGADFIVLDFLPGRTACARKHIAIGRARGCAVSDAGRLGAAAWGDGNGAA
ncbi:MAG: hypothetical protein AAF865_00485 [Pseudomonadota bacterium]